MRRRIQDAGDMMTEVPPEALHYCYDPSGHHNRQGVVQSAHHHGKQRHQRLKSGDERRFSILSKYLNPVTVAGTSLHLDSDDCNNNNNNNDTETNCEDSDQWKGMSGPGSKSVDSLYTQSDCVRRRFSDFCHNKSTSVDSAHFKPQPHTDASVDASAAFGPRSLPGVHLDVTPDPEIPVVVGEATGPSERSFKVIFIGDAGVGKTSFIVRVIQDNFVPELISSTLGLDFHVRSLRVNGHNVTLQVYHR